MTNFEDITHPLTKMEMGHVDTIYNLLLQATKQKQLSNGQLLAEINWRSESEEKLTPPRIRKIIRYLRINKKVPIIATSKGYFISNNIEELKKQSKSLGQRAKQNLKLKETFDLLIKAHQSHESQQNSQEAKD